jgi:hypothetical protein
MGQSLSGRDGVPTIIPIAGATTEERVLENGKVVKLADDDMKEIERVLKENEIVGERYEGPMGKLSEYQSRILAMLCHASAMLQAMLHPDKPAQCIDVAL